MALTPAQRLERIRVRLGEMPFWRERESVPVGGWTFDGAPIALGDFWPRREGVAAFSASAEVPAHWPLIETRLILDLGGEGLVSLTYPDGGVARFGNDPYHREFPVRAARFEIAAETVARLPFGEPVREPRLNAARLSRIDGAVHALHLRLTQLHEAALSLGEHEVVPHLIGAAETAFHALDWPSSSQGYISRFAPQAGQQKIWQLPELSDDPPGLTDAQRDSVVAADAALVETLRALQVRYPQQGEIALTGHAHIDLAWLWPYDETRRKMRRTFHTALSLMEGSNAAPASEGFRFNQSTAQYYAQIEEDDPALFEAIRAQVKAGSWETIGGMWVEPDTNMPTGESLARQILYGQRYFEEKFGIRHTVCWLPDCFGFSAALPQLLRQGGITSFFTIKVNWSETNKFPADLFWWEGLDGSRVLAHTFENPEGGYNGRLNPRSLLSTWRNFRGKVAHDTSLLAVGYGDGGGGVTPEFVEREVQLRDFPALPRARWGRVEDFFSSAHETAKAAGLPVWQGDIYLELHRGTLTTQSDVKGLHRQAERALITAETLESLVALLGGDLPVSLEPLWRVVLKNEFHDILPGSSIAEVYADARRELGEAIDVARDEQDRAMAVILDRLPIGRVDGFGTMVVNPSLAERAWVRSDGAQFSVPPLGIAVIENAPAAEPVRTVVDEWTLENEWLRATLSPDGTLASLIHKPSGREALAGRGNQLWVYPADKPRNWDAWDIEDDYARSGVELTEHEGVIVNWTGQALTVRRTFRNSWVATTYTLKPHGRRLEIGVVGDWHDRHCLLRTLTPVAVRTTHATFEHAHGVVRRTTHDNTSWDQAQFEVPGHRFCDMSEAGFGVGLLNTGKYGHGAKGNVLGLSIVRGPVYPDPLADEGLFGTTYALYPHEGEWYEGGVREEAEDLNQPLLTAGSAGVEFGVYTPLATSGIDSALSGLKPGEDGKSLILRTYEPAGRRGSFGFTLPEGWRNAGTVSILEEPMETPEMLMPFEVRSYRLVRE